MLWVFLGAPASLIGSGLALHAWGRPAAGGVLVLSLLVALSIPASRRFLTNANGDLHPSAAASWSSRQVKDT